MSNGDIKDSCLYVLLAGGVYEYPPAVVQDQKEHLSDLSEDLAELIKTKGVFVHKSPQSGMVTMIGLDAGMPLQIVTGSHLKEIQRERQYAAAMQGHQGMRPNGR